jgi:hypothetical protein
MTNPGWSVSGKGALAVVVILVVAVVGGLGLFVHWFISNIGGF